MANSSSSWPPSAPPAVAETLGTGVLPLLVATALILLIFLERLCWAKRGIGLCGICALCPGRVARHTTAMVMLADNTAAAPRRPAFEEAKWRVRLKDILTPAERNVIPV